MVNNKKYKIMIMVIVILSVTTVGLSIFITYDKLISKDKCDSPIENTIPKEKQNDNKVYEIMSDEEIKKTIDQSNLGPYFKKTSYFLTRQADLIFDVEKFLNEQNDEILEKILYGLFNDSSSSIVTKEEIMQKTRESYGYDLDFNFSDIGSGEDIDFKWDSKTQSYILTSWEVLAGHGYCDFDVISDIVDIKKLDDNSYDVYTLQLWTAKGCEGDMMVELYDSYQSALDEYNPIISAKNETENLFKNTLNKVKKKYEKGNYRYRIAKENGIIKIIQYIAINQY